MVAFNLADCWVLHNILRTASRFQPKPRTFVAILALVGQWASATLWAAEPYQVQRKIPAEAKYWDYSSIDPEQGQLYLGRMGGVLALDLKTGAVTEPLFTGELIHAVIPVEGHWIVAADGPKNELKVYDRSTHTVRTTVSVGGHPDAIAFDPHTRTVVTVNKASQDVSLIDTATWKVTGSIKLPGDPEFATTDDNGTLYVNLADQDRIAVIDLASKRIVGNRKLEGCLGPSGIAYSRKAALLISVCGNGIAKFFALPGLDAEISIAVGRGADAVLLDEQRNLVFIPAGADGTLSVISVRSATDVALVETVKTEPGAASGAVDPFSGRVYLPAGRRLRAPAKSGGWLPPTIAKGSFHILVIGPKTSATP